MSKLYQLWQSLLRYIGINKLKPKIYTQDQHSIQPKRIQQAAFKIASILKASGYDGYVVGGAIRDILIGKHPKDFDVVTNAEPEKIKTLFKRAMIIGRRFKIVHITIGHHTLEVSTFRSKRQGKINQDGMRINDNIYGTMNEDILRRDFTINGLYYDPVELKLYDFLGALDDINTKIIRVIGEPKERFREDPVRMLRAARLSAKLNFDIDTKCLEAIGEMKHLLAKVSSDRLSLEIQKLFYGGYGQQSLEKLYTLGLFQILFPQTYACIENPKTASKTKLMLSQAMYNADKRHQLSKSLSTAFLYATLLWWPLKERLRAVNPRDNNYLTKYIDACHHIISTQQNTTSIPKKIVDGIISIWKFQITFTKGEPLDPERIIHAPRFRAALDLLVLRAHVNEPVWWQAQKWHQLTNEITH